MWRCAAGNSFWLHQWRWRFLKHSRQYTDYIGGKFSLTSHSLPSRASIPQVVEIGSGKISGRSMPVDEGRFVNVFMGIPYAKPPVGILRFQEPQPADRWNGVRNCLRHSPKAPQKELLIERFIANRVASSEDCLYLNIFAPAWPPPHQQPNGFPVMVFIHGGAFAVHSSSFYGDIGICRSLCAKDIIVVTIQYRLGILGFAATGDRSCIANLGLRDQTFALQWIKKNIWVFKGDPDNITIAGQSAGGVCVDLLMLSPYSQDLFSKAIAISGTAECAWAMNDIRKVCKALRFHALKIGWKCPADANENAVNLSMMEFLKGKKASELSLGVRSLRKRKDNIYGIDFAPVVDGDFFPAPINELRRTAPKKTCMTGTTEFEGLFFASYRERRYNEKAIDSLISEFIKSGDEEIKKKALALYPTEGKSKKEIVRTYMRYHPQTFGAIGWAFPFIDATHGTDLPYLFGKPIFTGAKFNANDFKMLDQYTKLITNFVKNGSPNEAGQLEWQPLTIEDTWRYYNIHLTSSMQADFQERRPAFWHALEGIPPESESATGSQDLNSPNSRQVPQQLSSN
uniref:Carboxylesterase type B domain-containing protein n=1 Tax=Parascaris univalens TaxID=6257 RepID=A0A915BMM7_PARUN